MHSRGTETSLNHPPRRLPFPFSAEAGQVNDEIQKRILRRANTLRSRYISESNIYRLKHGRQWQSMHADEPEVPAETKLHTTEFAVSMSCVIDHDLDQLAKFLVDLSDKMHHLLMGTMFELLDNTTCRTGNVVSGKDFKQSFEEMLSKIAFGVDKYGTPSLPQMIVPPIMARQIEIAAQTPDPEHSARVATITDQKRKEAIANEARRISRYRLTR